MEMLVLPGGMGGVNSMAQSSAATALIEKANAMGCWLAAICAAPTLLAKLGILDGREAVCYPGLEKNMGAAKVRPDQEVVVDGRIVTSRAAGTAYEFGFALIGLLTNPTKAEEVRHGIYYRTGKDAAAC